MLTGKVPTYAGRIHQTWSFPFLYSHGNSFPSGAEFYCNADADFQCPECGNCPLPYDSGFLSDWERFRLERYIS